MKRWVFFLISALMVLVLSACGVALQVSHHPQGGQSEELPGVPFYTKAATCQQETIWLEQVYKLSLTGTKNAEKPVEVISLTNEVSVFDARQSADFGKLVRAVSQNNASEAVAAFNSLPARKLPIKDSLLETEKLVMLSNQSKPFIFVDYTDAHFFNSKVPVIGSTSPEINLNEDLTLAKASVKVENEALKTILEALPIKEVLGAVAGVPVEKKVGAPPAVIQLKLAMEQKVYKYVISTVGEKVAKLPCGNPGPPMVDIRKGNFEFNLVEAGAAKEKEGNVVKFSGSVNLPEAGK
jgi:hypothetical protein